ncbi:hypothetical protein [Thermomonospora sp. CIF 1]|uniref:hypothetical protein n=1 Tax=Thermomonospora sp. CIF 1 TaxID=1916083 RepID=UPI000CC6E69F|nr:hypothetical protein [Thermomonospora sp. CIF 1]PKK16350.1 MAG: hypothetical protein BUE48_000820 [Thermomonospora sp. CIF 1]
MPQATSPQVLRFRLLCSLCYLLRECGCESVLLWPIPGEAVLRVLYPGQPDMRLNVAVVECRGAWMFAFGPYVTGADDVHAVAARIARLVGAK